MRHIQAPHEFVGDDPAMFLAGAVSDAEHWQRKLIQMLASQELVVLNPRWDDFPCDDSHAAARQIEWEHRHLSRADLVVFWFAPQTLCPITLFELGACCGSGSDLVVGCDSEYALRTDVRFHLQLRRPDVSIAPTLEVLAHQVSEYFCKRTKRPKHCHESTSAH